MKKSIILLICIFSFSYVQVNAQQSDFYYTFQNNKINLIKISDRYLAEFPNGLSDTNTLDLITHGGKKVTDKTFLVINPDRLANYNSEYYIAPSYLTSEGKELYYTKEILLKFKKTAAPQSREQLVSSKNLTFVKSSTSYIMFRVSGDALQVSKSIYETGLVEFCTPNFIANVQSTEYNPNDPLYNQQWYLNNTGQGTNDGKTTTGDADIDAPEAWEISKGDPNVIVAVIDEGVTSDHPDLPNSRQLRLNGSNFAYLYDGTNDPNNPSPTVSLTDGNNHGNACAGIIGATQDNGIGITGIAPLCTIMPIKIPYGNIPVNIYADAIDFANMNGADILSNSWGYGVCLADYQPVIVAAINAATENNKLVVFSAGNNADRYNGDRGGWGCVSFPGCIDNPKVITVGASDRNNVVANYSPNGVSLEMVAPSHSAYNSQIAGESFNIWSIDTPGAYGYNSWKNPNTILPAVGEFLPNAGDYYEDYTGRMGGTSAAAPQVAAVAALIKSVNSCMSATQIKSILELTADKIGPYNYNLNATLPGHSQELGYGKLNAHRALQMAQQINATSLDLVVKDSYDDFGLQPNTVTQYMWNSQDIWVRHAADNGLEHQNPLYIAGVPNYIYVKVVNNSCVASNGNEVLKVYWSKAGTSLQWPYNWDGSYTEPSPFEGEAPIPMGLPIGEDVHIPPLGPGEEIILSVQWENMPQPDNYVWINPEPWHFCLLARVVAENDPMYITETEDLYANVKNNNNIAWKNVTVVYPEIIADATTGSKPNIGGVVAVGNPYDEPHTFFLEMVKEDLETGKPIYDEAEVTIKMDETLYQAWERGGKQNERLEPTLDEKKRIVKGNHVLVSNIAFEAKEHGTMNVTFNFLTKEITEKTHYKYHIIQKDAATGAIIGGETYEIKKKTRPLFVAYAGGDRDADRNQVITINAEQINEAAIYNWYDMEGNLIFQGKDLTVSADITKKYKLEVIALADGYKDYTEVLVKLKENYLGAIAPNPSSENTTIDYRINEIGSAYLMVLGCYGNNNILNNYILDINSSQTSINISNYPNGFYTIALVCNGRIVDAKTLVKQ